MEDFESINLMSIK